MIDNLISPDNCKSWIIVDFASLFDNIHSLTVPDFLADLSFPFMASIKTLIEEELVRAGCKGFIANEPSFLHDSNPYLLKLLGPSVDSSKFGYSANGMLTVLNSFNDCLKLSNLAQSVDKRMGVVLNVRSVDEYLGSGPYGFYELLQKTQNMPMLDLFALYTSIPIDEHERNKLSSHLRAARYKKDLLIAPFAIAKNLEKTLPILGLELLGVSDVIINCFPLEIGCWAFPYKKLPDGLLFRVDIGKKDGLPNNFPAQIAGKTAIVKEVGVDSSILFFPGHFEGVFPAVAMLTGGNPFEPISIKEWEPDSLETFLKLAESFCVFVKKDDKISSCSPNNYFTDYNSSLSIF